eukprot:m.159329 g.159329  ORF g.159329 m.159329 type:complete len:1404 (+) comp24791_c0_seq2:67-4278(+)
MAGAPPAAQVAQPPPYLTDVHFLGEEEEEEILTNSHIIKSKRVSASDDLQDRRKIVTGKKDSSLDIFIHSLDQPAGPTAHLHQPSPHILLNDAELDTETATEPAHNNSSPPKEIPNLSNYFARSASWQRLNTGLDSDEGAISDGVFTHSEGEENEPFLLDAKKKPSQGYHSSEDVDEVRLAVNGHNNFPREDSSDRDHYADVEEDEDLEGKVRTLDFVASKTTTITENNSQESSTDPLNSANSSKRNSVDEATSPTRAKQKKKRHSLPSKTTDKDASGKAPGPKRKFKGKTSLWISRGNSMGKLAAKLKPEYVPPDYSSFISRLLQKYLSKVSLDTVENASGNTFDGAVLFSDASGFTALTERLDKKGKESGKSGAEGLCVVLNDFFSRLLAIVEKYGGDVVKFAGDALCIVFPVDANESTMTNGFISPDLKTATLRACACSNDIHKALHGFPAIPATKYDKGVQLSLHMGIGCGKLTAVHVGGIFDRWEYILAGPPVAQIAIAEPLAKSKETVLSPEAYRHVQHVIDGTSVSELIRLGKRPKSKAKHGDFMLINRVNTVVSVPPSPPLPPISEKVASLMRRYIPNAILKKLDSHQKDHLSDILDVAVIFVNVQGLELVADDQGDVKKAVAAGQMMMLEIQRIVYQFEGSVNKLLVDDKGLLAMCALGLPPMPHPDDAARAVYTALELKRSLPITLKQKMELDIQVSVGVSSGRAFCGVVGSNRRREYTLMGNIVNLAARLMGAATKFEGCILVDKPTRDLALKSTKLIEFSAVEPLELKGKAKKTPAFEPTMKKGDSTNLTKKTKSGGITGREKEMEVLTGMVKKLISSKGGALVLTGGRGSGKTKLVAHLRKLGAQHRMEMFPLDTSVNSKPADLGLVKASATLKKQLKLFQDPSMDHAEHFKPWQHIVHDMILSGSGFDNVTPRDWIESALVDQPNLLNAIHLLNFTLPFNHDIPLPPTKTIDPGAGEVSLICKMVSHLIHYFCTKQPLFIMLHIQTGTNVDSGVDNNTWELAHSVARYCSTGRFARPAKEESTLHENGCAGHHPVILCVATRPLVDDRNVNIVGLKDAAIQSETFLQLRPLNEFIRRKYAAQCLGVSEAAMTPSLLQFLSDRAAGNPKHIKECVDELLSDRGRGVEDGVGLGPAVKILPTGSIQILSEDLNKSPVPQQMKVYIAQEFFQLINEHQLLLKIASTFPAFTPGMLRDVFNIDTTEENRRKQAKMYKIIQEDLNKLMEADFLEQIPHTPTSVHAYYPDDITKASSYRFVNRFLQHHIASTMEDRWKEKLQSKVRLRVDEVHDANVRLQAFVRGHRARKQFKFTKAVMLIQRRVRAKLRRIRLRLSERSRLQLLAEMSPQRKLAPAREFYTVVTGEDGKPRRVKVLRNTGRKLPPLPSTASSQA